MATTQVTTRIPDELVEFMEQRVSAGAATGKADVIAQALRRERRRVMYAEEARAYPAGTPDDPDMAALSEWAARQTMDID